jgi:hypothetical protein
MRLDWTLLLNEGPRRWKSKITQQAQGKKMTRRQKDFFHVYTA